MIVKTGYFLKMQQSPQTATKFAMHVTNALPGHSIRAVYPKTKISTFS